MAQDAIALKVRILLEPQSGNARYPRFNDLQIVRNSGMDWSKYVDTQGGGWMYDKCGHKEEESDSPRGEQWGLLLVPQLFAEQAEDMFPNQCFIIDKAEAEDFYDNCCACDEGEEEIDTHRLTEIKLKQDLGIALTQKDQDAINPATTERGVRPNRKKKLKDRAPDLGLNVVDHPSRQVRDVPRRRKPTR